MSTTNNNKPQESSEPEIIATRNYTGPDEEQRWWYIKRWKQDYWGIRPGSDYRSKEAFRTRRSWDGFVYDIKPRLRWTQVLRARFGRSNDIGAFLRLTNSYLLVCGEEESEKFSKTVVDDLDDFPFIGTTLGGCKSIGCMCVGNKHGLIVPETTYDVELKQIKEQLPDSVEVRKIEERLSALGNVIACNDRVALIHPELDKESEEIIADTLKVETFRCAIAGNPLVGSCCVLNDNGGLVHVDINNDELEKLAFLLQIPLIAGTVNSGVKTVASGLVANDLIVYTGMKTTSREIGYIEKAFGINKNVSVF